MSKFKDMTTHFFFYIFPDTTKSLICYLSVGDVPLAYCDNIINYP